MNYESMRTKNLNFALKLGSVLYSDQPFLLLGVVSDLDYRDREMLSLRLDHVMRISEGGSCHFCTRVETESETLSTQFVFRC